MSEPTGGSIVDQVRDYVLSTGIPASSAAPPLGRVEVGTHVFRALWNTATDSWPGPSMYEMPVTVNYDLHPLEWRIYDGQAELVNGGALKVESPR